MFECQILEFLALVGIKRFGRIYNKSEDALELRELDKKRFQFLGDERGSERKKGLWTAYAASL